MDASMPEDTMNVVFDQISDAGLMDSSLLLLLRAMLGQRNASEICSLSEERIHMELWLRTDDEIGDFTTEEASKLLRTAIDKLSTLAQPVEENPRSFLIAVPQGAEDFQTVSSDIRVSGRNVGEARSTSGDILISNSTVEHVSSTSGDIELNNVIVFGSCRTTSGDILGDFYLAPGASVRTVSGDIRANYTSLSGEEVKNVVSYEKSVAPSSKTIGDLRPRHRNDPGAKTETVIITQTHKHVDYFMLNDEFAVCNSCGMANHVDEFNRKNGCPNCGK